MGRDAPETHPRAPHTAILGPLERLELWQDFRGELVRLCAKGMVVMGPFGCGATRCDPETCRAFFRLHIGPTPAAFHARQRRPHVGRGLIQNSA